MLTNKPIRFTLRMLEGLSLDLHFFRVYGGNSFPEKKPDPTGLNALIAESRADRERTVMVGDSAVDVQTARNAGVRACGVRWGFQPETFVASPPDFLIDDMRELIGDGPETGLGRRGKHPDVHDRRGDDRAFVIRMAEFHVHAAAEIRRLEHGTAPVRS